MIKINFLVEHLGNSQLAYYLILNMNKLVECRQDVDCIAFYNTLLPPCILPKFALMQMFEAWNQGGHTIATSIATARKMLNFSGQQTKLYYYVWDLEWTHGNIRKYDMYKDIFLNQNIVIIARSESHAKAIQNCFNREKVYIMDDFNEKQLIEVIESENSNDRSRAA